MAVMLQKPDSLRPYLSEFGLIKARVTVEIRWLQSLANNDAIGELSAFDADTNAFLDSIVDDFSESDAQVIKDIEATTNHDVKAVEYFIKDKFRGNQQLEDSLELSILLVPVGY